MINARRYFLKSFSLPIFSPLLAVLILRPGYSGWQLLVLVLWGSLIIGGIPYLLFIVGLLHWARNKDFRAIRRVTYVAPLLFILVFVYCVAALIPFQVLTIGEVRVEAYWVQLSCIFILIFGYFYVLLTNAGFYILNYLGRIDKDVEREQLPLNFQSSSSKKKQLIAAALTVPIFMIPVSLVIRRWERQNYPGRIAKANRVEDAAGRNSALVDIVNEQARAGRYEEAKATVSSYIGDKDEGYAGIVTAQVDRGNYEAAKSTAKLISASVPRLMAFNQIAVAQAKKGDAESAKRTFSEALVEAMKLEDAAARQYALSNLITGEAEAGLDVDLKYALDMIAPSELVDMYKGVAAIQARKGRIDAAKENFREAISRAQTFTDAGSRARHLEDISNAQADAGLIAEAKITAEMIAVEGYKKAALYHISLIKTEAVDTQKQ
jgi:tetratricopeptide (TPR) repeat protein